MDIVLIFSIFFFLFLTKEYFKFMYAYGSSFLYSVT